MFARQRKARVLFGLSDVLLASLGFEAAYETRSFLRLEHIFFLTLQQKVLVLGSALVALVAAALWLEIYEKLDSAHPRLILRDASRQVAHAALCLVVLEYSVRLELSRPFLVLFATYTWVLLLVFRLTAGRVVGVVRRGFLAPHQVLIAGTGARALRLAQALERSSEFDIHLRGFLSEEENPPREIALGALYHVWPVQELTSILREQVIDEIIFAVGSESLADLEEVFLVCDEEGVRTRVAVDFFPHVNSTVSLERFGETPMLTFSAAPYDEVQLLVKRAIDVVLAAAALVVLSPLMVLIALVVRLTSPGPAIFRQVRCGLNGRRFVFYKFRSMVENAEELKSELAHLNTRDNVVFKIPDDPRLTPVGGFCASFRWTSGRNCGTCCAATCRW